MGGAVENGLLEGEDLGVVGGNLGCADFSQAAVDLVGVAFGAGSDHGVVDGWGLGVEAGVVFVVGGDRL